MATAVEVLSEAFDEMGTPFIVGHPGGETVELMDAARNRQVRFILMKQETAGAMLASTLTAINWPPSPGLAPWAILISISSPEMRYWAVTPNRPEATCLVEAVVPSTS